MKEEKFIEKKYNKLAERYLAGYIINARNTSFIYALLYLLRCEAHRELFIRGLEELIEK